MNTVILSLFGEVMLADNIYMWALERLIRSAAPGRAFRGRGAGGVYQTLAMSFGATNTSDDLSGLCFQDGKQTSHRYLLASVVMLCVCFRWGLWTQQVL